MLTTSLFQLLPEAADEESARKVGAGRKLLTFSDSRQAAAYAAPYLENSYGRLLERRILVETLRDDEFSEGAPIERWIIRAGQLAQQSQALPTPVQVLFWRSVCGCSRISPPPPGVSPLRDWDSHAWRCAEALSG